jgi:hypothetical protein
MNKRLLRSTVFILSAGLLIVCAVQTPQTSEPTETPSETGAAAATATLPLTATFTPTPSATAQPAAADVGWILVKSEHGLWGIRSDGGLIGIRISGRIIVPGPLADAVSQADGLFAYLTNSGSSQPSGNYPDLTLNIVSLMGRGEAAAVPLTSPEAGYEFPSDIEHAIVYLPSFAWSPEGMRLAFIGAQEGPSADLYEYYRESGDVVQLTDGPIQAYRPLWSPGGEWIVHFAADSFGTGAGYLVTGAYAARADESGVISLYDIPKHSGDELAAGWLDGHTLVAHSWYATCGPSDLRLVDLDAEKADLVFEGCLSAVAIGGGSVLFAQSPGTAGYDEDPRPGMYLLTASDRTPRLIGDEDIQSAVWLEGVGAFLAHTEDGRLLEVDPAGEIRTLPAVSKRRPIVSPDGRYWAYVATEFFDGVDGVFAGEYGKELTHIFTGEAVWNQLLFSPAGDSLYFISSEHIVYGAEPPDWEPDPMAWGVVPDPYEESMAWMEEE